MIVEWREVHGDLKPFVEGQEVAWAAQAGSQQAFLACPVFEALLEGPRGGGKTDVFLMDFAQHTGQGWGADWRGIIFRQTFPQLSDLISKSKQWFPRIFPRAKFNESKSTWTWPTGEELLLRRIEKPDDYWDFHGHAYPWIGWEELTTWPDDKCYKVMMSCSRSTRAGMPRKYRSTTNPYGIGHNWVKARFNLPILPGRIVGDIIQSVDAESGEKMPERVAIHSRLQENKVLLKNEPNYLGKIRAAATNPAQLRAWEHGDWDITSGGMFDDIWDSGIHVLPNFAADLIPPGWRIDRSYDHGQSKPFSVGWWAESNGEPIEVGKRVIGAVRGDLIRFAEWYGWCGAPNEGLRMTAREIALGILEREENMGLKGRVKMGPADTSIYDEYEPHKSVGGDMARVGVYWVKADKGKGSRKQGWEQLRKMMMQAKPQPDGPRELPGFFVLERCDQFRRTVPSLPRDDKDLDEVHDLSEDHIADECRYRVRVRRSEVSARSWR